MDQKFQKDSLALRNLRRTLVREMEDLTVDDLTTARVLVLERDLDRIRLLRNEYQDGIEDFLEEFQHLVEDENVLLRWRGEVPAIGREVKEHANRLRTKMEYLNPTSRFSEMEKKSLEIQERVLKVQEQSFQEQQKHSAAKVNEKEAEDLLVASTEANLFLGECSVLGDIMADENWEEADDETVGKAMRSLGKWQEQMSSIDRSYRKYENMAMRHSFAEEKKEAMKATYQDRKERFENTRDAVEKEDSDRGLFTLEPVKTDIIKYPTFAGLPSEDYLKFKETMQQRFRENKVKKKEQVAKLRECLKGVALGRVPEGVKEIEEAFSRLNEAFGNPSKVMNFNLKALEDLGIMPSEKLSNGLLNYSRKIEWLLKLEVILGKILELSKRSSKLAHEAFSSSTYRKLWARFPTQVLDKLVKIQGEDGDRLGGILAKLKEMREHAQIMDDECGNAAAAAKKKGDFTPPIKVTAELFFKSPQKFEECRICVHLSATKKNHQNLFENHLSNYATGCPKFVEATMEMRRSLVDKIKICPQCFHPDVVFSQGHLKECLFSEPMKKNAYSCTKCKTHMWICLVHRQDNSKHMDKFRYDLQRRGQNLGFTSYDHQQAFQSDPHAFNSAFRKIRRTEKKKTGEIVPVPDGEPLFLFHGAKGRTRAVNVFYDSGCSHAVFQSGVPGTELKGQLVAKGPFSIGGVGGITTTAEDEWVVLMPRSDGRKQLVQGLTVPKITSEFPLISLDAAVQALKDDDISNEILQKCRVPPLAGGSVDVLMGNKYNSIFPEPVHCLPNGLTIYKSRLASYQGRYDCCIGGPHSSFKVLANLAGGPAQLLINFVDGLRAYRQGGLPKITSLCLTSEEEMQATYFNTEEGDMEELREFGESLVEFGESMIQEEMEDMITCCSHCTDMCHVTTVSSKDAKVSSDDRIRDFKKMQQIHDSGLEIEYRCPACRECLDCKTADKTEKVSLREECERYEINKSVVIDLENKKIQCSLPLMGKERDYLTCNRDKALKILIQQCRKYHKDPETKKTILEAFTKPFSNGHAVLLSNLTTEQKKILNKEIQYHIPWRVVFSGSATTPTRPVMDASSRTSFRKDKTGGRSLNDLVAKGKIESINLVKVLLRFIIGEFALTGDLKQFYNAFKLVMEQWNLQRILWIDDLDPDGEVLEAVIVTLIYGVKSVSAQTEFALAELAKLVKEENPELALFLILSRYVDDLQDSKASKEECVKLASAADELFTRVGVECTAWTFSGSPPPSIVSKDGMSVGVGGFGWFPEGDILELKVPKLHFGNSRRGRLADSVKVFEGNEDEIDSFVPDPLSRRQAASKLASLWDILGKLSPIMNGLKLDLRETFKRTESWDEGMPADLRQKWVKNFLLFEKLRGLKYQRAVMPSDAVDSRLRLLTGVDAAKDGLMMGCWGGFRLKDGSWSNKLLLGRSLLAKSESIPKDELEALCAGSNMAWVVRIALQEWVDTSILFSDLTIALCWLTSEKLRLSLFHRNRVLQTRRGTDLETVYHVRTECNPADCGTRPDKVKLSDVGPESRWENGDQWMNLDIDVAVGRGVLKPATSLRVSKEIEDDFKKGLLFGDKDEILTGGFTANVSSKVSEVRMRKLEERATFSGYIFLPTKYSFPRTVRIYGYVLCFLKNARKGKKMVGELLKEADLWFSVFNSDMFSTSCTTLMVVTKADKEKNMSSQTKVLNHFSIKKLVFQNTVDVKECMLTDDSLHQALLCLFRKSSTEVKNFNNSVVINKIAYEKDGILLSKGRLLDGMNFVETGELGDLNIGSLGVKVNTPVLDRYSPLSYSIAQHMHYSVAKHRGMETTNRMSLEHVTIIQGMTLYREIADECWKCHMKRKKYLEVSMGPVAQEQLMLAPPFYITMIDLFGPVESYVPGFERNTRNRKVLETKMHVMVAVCITTKIVNLQILEGKAAHNIIDGFTRLSVEVGVPSVVHVDQDSGAMSGFRDAELDFRDLQHQLHKQFGISFSTCPVSGHHQHGLVERIIRSIQETFGDYNLKQKRLHSMGWQTFCKLAENAYNNVPIGYSHGRDQDNTELLKILTPNMLRVGKINSRALQGPIRLPVSKQELLEHVEKIYSGWFKIFKDTVVPRLINQPKWFKLDKDLMEKDIVYFQKEESALGSTWTVGEVDQVISGRDGLIRRAIIKYYNASENHPQFTDRAVRKLVKLWSMDEACLFDDLAELQERIDGARIPVNDRVDGEASLAAEEVSTLVGYSSAVDDGILNAGPCYVLLDGEQVDLAAYTTSCELTPLLVQPVHYHRQADQGQDSDQSVNNLDTLTSLMVSTGFSLD